MNAELKEGSIIEFESGSRFEIIKLFEDGFADLRSLEPHELLHDYYPVYYSIPLVKYKVLPKDDE